MAGWEWDEREWGTPGPEGWEGGVVAKAVGEGERRPDEEWPAEDGGSVLCSQPHPFRPPHAAPTQGGGVGAELGPPFVTGPALSFVRPPFAPSPGHYERSPKAPGIDSRARPAPIPLTPTPFAAPLYPPPFPSLCDHSTCKPNSLSTSARPFPRAQGRHRGGLVAPARLCIFPSFYPPSFPRRAKGKGAEGKGRKEAGPRAHSYIDVTSAGRTVPLDTPPNQFLALFRHTYAPRAYLCPP